jgi:hypothetical protein
LVEVLKRDIDMTLLQRNLKLTPQQRIDPLVEMQRFAAELSEAGRRGARAPMTDDRKAFLALAEVEALLATSTK